MKQTCMKVTVGLCLKNSGKTVQTALDSISRQDYPHEAMKLIIVDENERGDALPYLTEFTKKTDIKTVLYMVENKGLGASRQMVVDNAEGDYVVWVDDDFVLNKDFVCKHVEFMENNPLTGAALAKELRVTATTPVATFESYLDLLGGKNAISGQMGGFEIFRLTAINQVGGFDVDIKGAAEDGDIAIRIKNAGWQLSRNSSAEYYRKYPPTTWNALWRKHFWYGYGSYFLYRKYKTHAFRWELFFPLAFYIGLKGALKVYKINREQNVFLLSPYYFFRNAASFLGFFRANLDRYGHK
ncbi:MAG: glycosyltransferase [Candidatus Bathyarchaeota archaeon]|nr:glycosyltransferase [Candidatus Bathyarchaeota archaeon]